MSCQVAFNKTDDIHTGVSST